MTPFLARHHTALACVRMAVEFAVIAGVVGLAVFI